MGTIGTKAIRLGAKRAFGMSAREARAMALRRSRDTQVLQLLALPAEQRLEAAKRFTDFRTGDTQKMLDLCRATRRCVGGIVFR